MSKEVKATKIVTADFKFTYRDKDGKAHKVRIVDQRETDKDYAFASLKLVSGKIKITYHMTYAAAQKGKVSDLLDLREVNFLDDMMSYDQGDFMQRYDAQNEKLCDLIAEKLPEEVQQKFIDNGSAKIDSTLTLLGNAIRQNCDECVSEIFTFFLDAKLRNRPTDEELADQNCAEAPIAEAIKEAQIDAEAEIVDASELCKEVIEEDQKKAQKVETADLLVGKISDPQEKMIEALQNHKIISSKESLEAKLSALVQLAENKLNNLPSIYYSFDEEKFSASQNSVEYKAAQTLADGHFRNALLGLLAEGYEIKVVKKKASKRNTSSKKDGTSALRRFWSEKIQASEAGVSREELMKEAQEMFPALSIGTFRTQMYQMKGGKGNGQIWPEYPSKAVEVEGIFKFAA